MAVKFNFGVVLCFAGIVVVFRVARSMYRGDDYVRVVTWQTALNESVLVVLCVWLWFSASGLRDSSIAPNNPYLQQYARAQFGYVLYIGNCMSYVIKWACAGFGGWYGAKLYRTYQTLQATNTSASDDTD